MTKREVAERIALRFSSRCAGNSQTILNRRNAIGCAIICVDEIISSNPYSSSQGGMQKYWEDILIELEQMK